MNEFSENRDTSLPSPVLHFTAYWDTKGTLTRDLFKNISDKFPENGGYKFYKNVAGTCFGYRDADWLVVFDDVGPDILEEFKDAEDFMDSYGLESVIYFRRENPTILNAISKKLSWFYHKIVPKLKHNYTPENGYYYTFTPANFIQKTYDELKNMPYKKGELNLSAVVSYREDDECYKKRTNFMIQHCKKNKLDVYGSGWKKQLGKNYKGALGNYYRDKDNQNTTTKFDGLYKYNFSICLENYPDDVLASEKFTDAILSWCIPIYSGNKKAIEIFPEHSYHLIDRDDPNVHEKIREIIKKGVQPENIEALRKAREFILDKLNIWETVNAIIVDDMKGTSHYESNYRY